MSIYNIETLEAIAADKLGSTENFRELLDSLSVAPFDIPSMPEIQILSAEITQNATLIQSKVNEISKQINQAVDTGAAKLSSVIEQISWLF